jgi:hypothetical protein
MSWNNARWNWNVFNTCVDRRKGLASAPRYSSQIPVQNVDWEFSVRHRTALIPAALLHIFCAAVVLAQTSWVPPKPGPEVKKLGTFVGRWAIEGNIPAGTTGSEGGKTAGTASCEWVAERFGILCRETIPLPGKVNFRDVYILAYDTEAKNYFFTQVSPGGVIWTGRGTVNGDTWVWIVESTEEGKRIQFRFTETWISPDSYDFKNEVGESADSMKVMMEGKETRASTFASKPTEKK